MHHKNLNFFVIFIMRSLINIFKINYNVVFDLNLASKTVTNTFDSKFDFSDFFSIFFFFFEK